MCELKLMCFSPPGTIACVSSLCFLWELSEILKATNGADRLFFDTNRNPLLLSLSLFISMYTAYKSIEHVNEMHSVCLCLGVLVICTKVFISLVAHFYFSHSSMSSVIRLHLALFKNTKDESIAFSPNRMTVEEGHKISKFVWNRVSIQAPRVTIDLVLLLMEIKQINTSTFSSTISAYSQQTALYWPISILYFPAAFCSLSMACIHHWFSLSLCV